MSDEAANRAEMEQTLRDERSMRFRVEQRNVELTQRVDVWRTRAEERTARIDQLERERDIPWLRHLRNRVRRIMREPTPEVAAAPSATEDDGATSLPPRLPIVRVAASVTSPGLAPVLATTTSMGLDGIDGADVVLVEPDTPGGAPSEALDHLERWAVLPGRQPLVVWSTRGRIDDRISDLLAPTDVMACTSSTDVGKLEAKLGRAVVHAPPSFDPAHRSPATRGPDKVRPVTEKHLDDPPPWLVEQAAAGLGSDDANGVALRRWAFRRHAPWVRARQLFNAAGLSLPEPTDPVAGILVSNRPEQAVAAVRRIISQRAEGFRLAVGLHGVTTPPELRAVLEAAPIPTSVHELPSSYTLGECLNAVIAATPGRVLAKIDDDDYYGPSYLDDALHAMAYSGADIVGKGAHYTYLGAEDRTVLRRPSLEERFIDTMTTGASLVFARELWDAVRFPHRTVQEDTWFLGAARATGAKVYANTRFEFTYVRSGDGHTWQTDESTFLVGAEPAWDGLHPEHAFVADID